MMMIRLVQGSVSLLIKHYLFSQESSMFVCIVMDYYSKGDLRGIIKDYQDNKKPIPEKVSVIRRVYVCTRICLCKYMCVCLCMHVLFSPEMFL